MQIIKRTSTRDVIDEQGSRGTPVVGTGHGSVPFLAGRVPDLHFHSTALDLQCLGGELYADGGFGLEVELVLGEAGYDVGLAHARVPQQHYLVAEVRLFIIRHGSPY